MEDSEKRRERLKAMRAQAEAEASSRVETSAVSGLLANPLLDSSATLPSQDEPSTVPRFDYYTDPMAAFAANKRRPPQGFYRATNSGPPGPRFPPPFSGSSNPDVAPSPAYETQYNFSPNQRMCLARGPYRGTMASPFPMNQLRPDGGGTGAVYYSSTPYHGTSSPYPTNEGNQTFRPAGGPSFGYGQGRAPCRGYSPSFGPRPGGSSSHSRGSQGQWHGQTGGQVFGCSGGRGRGFHHSGNAPGDFKADRFYDKSMLEDPWKLLQPVIWVVPELPQSSASWLPESISTKRPRVSEPSKTSTSKQSLAEYLAASFNEAVKDAPSV